MNWKVLLLLVILWFSLLGLTGTLFSGYHLTDDQAFILEELELLAAETKPDAYLVSGDLFDRSVPPVEALDLLNDHLVRLVMDLHVPVIMIAGNHDSPGRIEFASRLLSRRGLFISGKPSPVIRPVVLEDRHGEVNFYPVPYSDHEDLRALTGDDTLRDNNSAMEKIIRGISSCHPPGKRSVVISHAFVGGGEACESERPLSIGGSGMVDGGHFDLFNFTALGHLHRPQCIGGNKQISYSGSLMKYSMSEAGHEKSVSLVEMDSTGECSVERIMIKPRRELRIIEGNFTDIIHGANSSGRDDYIAVTLLDRLPVYDAMNRLRAVYPNIIHLQRKETGTVTTAEDRADRRRMTEFDLFSVFHSHVTGNDIDGPGADVFNMALDELRKETQ